jgi:formate-dependent nitrite reductase cytochrome c552 subunit
MEASTAPEATEETTETETTEDQRVPYERFDKVNKSAKEAKQQAAALQKQLDELRSQMEEKESASLPELERERKAREKLEARLAEAEKEREQALQQATNVQRENWVAAAAASLNFHEPDDASRFVDLSDIESKADAERAVKDVAKRKKHLVKDEDTKLPGRVLKDGQRSDADRPSTGAIDSSAEAEAVGAALQDFLKNRSTGFSV